MADKANCNNLSGISGGFGAAMVAPVAVGVPFKTEMRWGRTKYFSTLGWLTLSEGLILAL